MVVATCGEVLDFALPIFMTQRWSWARKRASLMRYSFHLAAAAKAFSL